MKTIRILISGLWLILFILTQLQAQNRPIGGQIRQRMMDAKLREIRTSLNLDQETTAKLRPIYVSYEEAMMAINFRELAGPNQVNADSLSAEEAERMIMVQIANARKILDLREKYYARFRTVLTPQQIIRLYQTEAAIRRKVMVELRRRFGGRK